MQIRQCVEKKLLRLLDKLIPQTKLDEFLIERRRRLNNVTGYYPHAFFLSKKRADKKYCVVRYSIPNFALLAAGIQYLFCYHQLVEKGYTPIIDIEYTYSFKQGKIGEHNIWDACFKQAIPAKEAMKQPYVLATGELFSYSNDPKLCLEINKDIEDHYIHVKKEDFRNYYSNIQKYAEPIWQVKDELLSELDNEVWNAIKNKKVLGVFLREDFSRDVSYEGEDNEKIYSNHPLLPGVTEIIQLIKDKSKDWKFDYIFLSTVYEESILQFKEEFGEKILYINRERRSKNAGPIVDFAISEYDAYKESVKKEKIDEKTAQTYLKEVVALSRCDYLIGGASSGMSVALVMNGGKYEDIYILEDARNIKRY